MSDALVRDVGLVATVLALLSAKRISQAGAREALQGAYASSLDADQLLDQIGITVAEINGSLSSAKRAIEDSLLRDIIPVPIGSAGYPLWLARINDAPSIIYVRGSLSALSCTPGVAVVGTRKATPHGVTIAERLAEFLGNAGQSVISGLALGIDAAAHEGALKTSSPTIAVLAHGLEKASPRANAPLAARILEQGGAWISEHLIGTPAKPEYFVLRNRIQVGLACASIIVEGEERSGSMTQAEYCVRNRRTLFAVLPRPGDAVATQHRLPQMLVASRGAQPIRSKDDYPALLEMVQRKRSEMISTK